MNKINLYYGLRIIRYFAKALFPLAAIAALCIWGLNALWVVIAIILIRTMLRIVWRLAKLMLCAGLLVAVICLIFMYGNSTGYGSYCPGNE